MPCSKQDSSVMQPASLPPFRPKFNQTLTESSPKFGQVLTEHCPMQKGGDVLVKFASLNITTNSSKVTVKSGKFRRTMSVTEWSATLSQSMASPIPLNPKPKSNSSQVHLAYGLGFRLKTDMNGTRIQTRRISTVPLEVERTGKNSMNNPMGQVTWVLERYLLPNVK